MTFLRLHSFGLSNMKEKHDETFEIQLAFHNDSISSLKLQNHEQARNHLELVCRT